MDLSKDYEVQFEANKKYQAVIINSKIGNLSDGREYVSHVLFGMGGQRYEKKFYLQKEGGRRFYTRFLSFCGISKDQTANWNPKNLDGKLCSIEFKTSEYESYDDAGNKLIKESFDIKNFGTFSGSKDDKEMLQATYEFVTNTEEEENPF